MDRIEISKLNISYKELSGGNVLINGWVKTLRSSKDIGFIEVVDGTSFKGVQVVFESSNLDNFSEIAKYNTFTSISVEGELVITEGAKQPFEIKATKVSVIGESSPDYPLQNKRHSLEYLRSIAHLRPRANTFYAAFKVRSEAAFAIHKFFNERGFVYAHTPIITGSDCEGAGEMFRVTTLDMQNTPKNEDGSIDYSADFFSKETSLTVSGQLEAECMAMAFGNVYTFGPTFRAENSNTPRHVAEFWMIEPEIAFGDLNDDMELARDMVQYVISHVLNSCKDELAFFNSFVDKGLLERLNTLVRSEFKSVSYTEAVEILENSGEKFEFKPYWGCDLQTEHERYLTEKHFKGPVFVINYPKEIKAFYMRSNDDGKTVAAMDMLVPGIGELIGGSQREERLDVLISKIEEMNLPVEDYSWYLDLRRFGTVPHAGFGLGFERLVMYLTGISNIRDAIPFPRTPGNAEY